MDESIILYVAITVFSLMVVGLALTIREFSQGEPHKQAESSRREQESRQSQNTDNRA